MQPDTAISTPRTHQTKASANNRYPHLSYCGFVTEYPQTTSPDVIYGHRNRPYEPAPGVISSENGQAVFPDSGKANSIADSNIVALFVPIKMRIAELVEL